MSSNNAPDIQPPEGESLKEATGRGQVAPITYGTAITLCVISGLVTLVLAVFLPAIAAKQGIPMPGASTYSSKVVSLDFERLLSAGLKGALASSTPASEMEQHANKFQAEISRVLRRYNDAGIVVINHKALIAGPASLDITDAVIRELGLAP